MEIIVVEKKFMNIAIVAEWVYLNGIKNVLQNGKHKFIKVVKN